MRLHPFVLPPRGCDRVSQQNDWPGGDEHNHAEGNQLREVTGLYPVCIAITEETRGAKEHRVSSFHVHVDNRQCFERPRSTAKVTFLSLWRMADEERIYRRLTRRRSTRRRNSCTKDSTDNNPARSKYHISPRARESHYWRSKHRRNRQEEVQKRWRRPARRSSQCTDSFSVCLSCVWGAHLTRHLLQTQAKKRIGASADLVAVTRCFNHYRC